MMDKLILRLLIAAGFLSSLWFADFWFFSEARRDSFWFPILTVAIFWGIYRSFANWALIYFITPSRTPSLSSSVKWNVDVLTTAMPGEPFAMFEESLRKIQAMEWPHRTFLLDGGNDPELMALCMRLGVTHVDCRNIPGAKAGKVNYCLRTLSDADFVFIIDPDHRPRPDMLSRVLPFFEDSQIGFVQVVQAYYNIGNSFVANAAAEQTFSFYGPTLMSLHGLGIPTAIGANCVFRRKALDSIGGHAEHLAEDALTSMRLHAEGWRSAYLPYRGTEGLVPEDLSSFFKQQVKWATGMFEILFREYPKLFRKFNGVERIHYFNAGTFYFNGLATFLMLVLPIYFLFAQKYAVEFSLQDFMLHLAPYAICTLLTYRFMSRFYTHPSEKRFPWRSLALEKASWYVSCMGLLSGLLHRRVEYIPTPKSSDHRAMPMLVLPNLIAIGVSLMAVAYAFFTYYRLDGGAWWMISLALLNVLVMVPVTVIALFPKYNWGSHDSQEHR